MRYTTIGSGTAVPQIERSAPCHLIHVGTRTILVDLGPGSIWGLLRHGRVSLTDIGLLLFTHLHMDHCADLAPMLFALRSPELARTQPLHILGPGGIHEHYQNLRRTWGNRVDPAGFDMTVEEWSYGVFSWYGCRISAAPTSHSVPNLAWRIDSGAEGACGVVITGDGRSTDELIALAGGADHVLVAEAAAGVGEVVDGHMNPAQAAILARMCGSQKLVLNHINPGTGRDEVLKEAMAHFGGEVIVAEDGMEIEIA